MGYLIAFLIAIVINITVGAWSVIEILSWFGKSIPIWADVLIGLFLGEVSIPIAIVGYLLRIFGVF